ncbi:leupaxin-like [Liolophura sinensis]|uniref:leupaxin-like n=1 Tax=Liolophura sinensis TaxID=3198878 RepID=UPI0031588E5A
MEDLDALLADLQSTTAHISNYQQQHKGAPPPASPSQHNPPLQQYSGQRQSYSSARSDSRGSTPPPLPPPPPSDVLDGVGSNHYTEQPIYEPQNVRASPLTPNLREEPVTVHRSFGSSSSNSSRDVQPSPKPGMSLSNNLSELDQLLQDLNSAQFMAEVDRRNAVNQPMVNGTGDNSGVKTPKSPGYDNKRSSVDNLLDQLENSVPSPASRPPLAAPTNRDSYDYPVQTIEETRTVSTHEQKQVHGASTATQELDELMDSLSQFKMQSGGQAQITQHSMSPAQSAGADPPYAKPHKGKGHETPSPVSPSRGNSQLDAMLGNLQSDMNRQGVSTKTKGTCAACCKPVVGQVITALGKLWHVEHFVCAHCKLELGTQNFYERDGQAYCEKDYHNLFAPRCAYCNGPILDKCVTALGTTWHPEHFFCSSCGETFGEDGFHERDGKAFCRRDYFDMFAPKCGGCSRAIMNNYISALNRQWHPECFICQECHVPFGGGSFFDHEGLPYCETHYHAKRGSLCASCHKPITGRCITAMYRKFHPEHFVCAFCLTQLNKGTFKEQNDKPYCHPCFVKLFG